MNKPKNESKTTCRSIAMRTALMIGVVLLGIALAWQFLLSYGASRGFEMTATMIQATNQSVSTSVVATGLAATEKAILRSQPSAIDMTLTSVFVDQQTEVAATEQFVVTSTALP